MDAIRAGVPAAKLEPAAVTSADELPRRPSPAARWSSRPERRASCCCPKAARAACPDLKVAIDLNAVPPLGIEGVEVGDKGKERDGVICYGAIGVGDTKMKVHRAAVARLFESNDQILDAEQVYAAAQAF